MLTIQGLRMKTDYMMEQIRQNAIRFTLSEFEAAARHYYETAEGGNICTKLIRDLESLGVDMETVIDLDLAIRDEVEAKQKEATHV